MKLIRHLKSLGLDLKRIKEILGDKRHDKTLREVLESLRMDLLREKKSLEERIVQIDVLLREDKTMLDEDVCDSPSFQMITGILQPRQMEDYAKCSVFWMTFSGERTTRIRKKRCRLRHLFWFLRAEREIYNTKKTIKSY